MTVEPSVVSGDRHPYRCVIFDGVYFGFGLVAASFAPVVTEVRTNLGLSEVTGSQIIGRIAGSNIGFGGALMAMGAVCRVVMLLASHLRAIRGPTVGSDRPWMGSVDFGGERND